MTMMLETFEQGSTHDDYHAYDDDGVNVRMIVVCDFCRCDIFRVVVVHIRVGLMGAHLSDDPRAPHTK